MRFEIQRDALHGTMTLTDAELKHLLTSPDALRAVADYNDFNESMADSQGADASFNRERRAWFNSEAKRIEAEWEAEREVEPRALLPTHLAQPAQAVETVRAWPKFVQDECLEVLRNMDTELGATGRKSARIERLINAIAGMPAQNAQAVVSMDAISMLVHVLRERGWPIREMTTVRELVADVRAALEAVAPLLRAPAEQGGRKSELAKNLADALLDPSKVSSDNTYVRVDCSDAVRAAELLRTISAEQGGRVDEAKLLRDVRAIYIGSERPTGDGCDAETWDRIEAALAQNIHADHGKGTGGPDDSDCPCRGTTSQKVCASSGCGFCKAAQNTQGELLARADGATVETINNVAPSKDAT